MSADERSTSVSSMRRTNTPPVPPRVEPVEQGRPRAADVQVAGGRRGEAEAGDGHLGIRGSGFGVRSRSVDAGIRTAAGQGQPESQIPDPNPGDDASNGGEAGIRTLDTGFGPYNGLANRRLQPLGHLTLRLAALAQGEPFNLRRRSGSSEPRDSQVYDSPGPGRERAVSR